MLINNHNGKQQARNCHPQEKEGNVIVRNRGCCPIVHLAAGEIGKSLVIFVTMSNVELKKEEPLGEVYIHLWQIMYTN